MATGATGTPTTNYSIPKYATSADAPNGTGFNSAMDAIDAALKGVADASLVVHGVAADGKVPVYNSGDGFASWGDAASGSASVTPVNFQAPSAGAFWTVTALGTVAWLAPHWELPDAATSLVYGTVLVPAGVTDATLRLILAANATTGTAVVKASVASAAEAETLAPATWGILNTTNNVAMPGTAWLRKDTTFSLTGLTGGDLLPIAISRLGSDGSDSLAANLALFGAWLEAA
jgi:hypothetical protein